MLRVSSLEGILSGMIGSLLRNVKLGSLAKLAGVELKMVALGMLIKYVIPVAAVALVVTTFVFIGTTAGVVALAGVFVVGVIVAVVLAWKIGAAIRQFLRTTKGQVDSLRRSPQFDDFRRTVRRASAGVDPDGSWFGGRSTSGWNGLLAEKFDPSDDVPPAQGKVVHDDEATS